LPFFDEHIEDSRRFWKSEDDGDKNDAYRTLHYTLLKLSVILAPFTPFLAEELYQKLGGGAESVHLLDWPANYTVDQQVLDEMNTVRDYVNQALSIRAKERVKIRQPLASVTVPTGAESFDQDSILQEELNVKEVIVSSDAADVTLDLNVTPELKREGLMREVVRHVQAARKDAGLNVDDRIVLALMVLPNSGSEELAKAIEEHQSTIAEETLAEQFADVKDGYDNTVTIEGMELRICLKKA
jgi:isoleucyl-tRNA synthetase